MHLKFFKKLETHWNNFFELSRLDIFFNLFYLSWSFLVFNPFKSSQNHKLIAKVILDNFKCNKIDSALLLIDLIFVKFISKGLLIC